jgi:hypothetical protein
MESGESAMDRAMNLRDIFHNLSRRSDKWDPYFDVYERYLTKFVGAAPRVVEIGVQGGGSLEMWSKWFGPEAKIVGVDIDPACSGIFGWEKEISVIINSQSDTQTWEHALQLLGKIDVLIDDGSHFLEDQKRTFEIVFPLLSEGGIYIVEDCHTSYMESYGGGGGAPHTLIEYAKTYVDVLNRSWWEQSNTEGDRRAELAKGLSGVHFYDSIVVFEKSSPKEMKRVFSK